MALLRPISLLAQVGGIDNLTLLDAEQTCLGAFESGLVGELYISDYWLRWVALANCT